MITRRLTNEVFFSTARKRIGVPKPGFGMRCVVKSRPIHPGPDAYQYSLVRPGPQ
jgi:hypothetical protein